MLHIARGILEEIEFTGHGEVEQPRLKTEIALQLTGVAGVGIVTHQIGHMRCRPHRKAVVEVVTIEQTTRWAHILERHGRIKVAHIKGNATQ
jgi:hypothetical protein